MSLPISLDLRDEAVEFHAFLETLDEDDWTMPTLFMDWTPWDVIAHLHFFDLVSMDAVAGREAFESRQKTLAASLRAGRSTADFQREALGGLGSRELLERWRVTCLDLAERLGDLEAKARLPWFGPDMGAQMFATARYMEMWSHAQAIYDMKAARREVGDRIRNVVAIGVRTFGWTFVNRKLPVPEPVPHVRLVAPSGEVWAYNDPSEVERVEGPALDFCQVVTQVRNVRDTSLEVRGEVANRWMSIAQCFAGRPVDPPPPGRRVDP